MLKYVKCHLEEMITYKNKLVKIFKAKSKCIKKIKRKKANANRKKEF